VIVSFHPLAERELNDAAQYYEMESQGLGSAFLAEVQRCCASIVEHPEAATQSAAPCDVGWSYETPQSRDAHG